MRHRTCHTRGAICRESLVRFVFKLRRVAEGHWRRLNRFVHFAQVITGVRFSNPTAA